MNASGIYLDHAAATPLDDRVLAAMQPYFAEQFYNPSSPYAPAVAVRREYEQARHRLAICLGAQADEVVITAGATESINVLFASVSGHIVTSAIEHPAVLEAARRHDHTVVAVDKTGIVSAAAVVAAITPETQLVSIALANNEIGTIQPIKEITALIADEAKKRRQARNNLPIYVHTDASQGVGQIDAHVARLGVDAMTINAGKLYGPKQVGLLWTARHLRLSPLIVGGGQERGLRSGTENVAGTIGFATALELATDHRKSEAVRLAALRDQLQQALCEAHPKSLVIGNQSHRLPGHLLMSFPGLDAERLVFTLEQRQVYVATGSACAANKGTRSHVLTAIGCSDTEADGSLRFTLGRLTTAETIASASAIINEVISAEYARVAA
ncbi:MAG: cysteine desulfurase family protein [Candidatus Saccharimonas sp.]